MVTEFSRIEDWDDWPFPNDVIGGVWWIPDPVRGKHVPRTHIRGSIHVFEGVRLPVIRIGTVVKINEWYLTCHPNPKRLRRFHVVVENGETVDLLQEEHMPLEAILTQIALVAA